MQTVSLRGKAYFLGMQLVLLSSTIVCIEHAGAQASSRDSTAFQKRSPLPDGHSDVAGLASRGKYIAVAADCGSCHSAPNGKPFAGGNPLKSPFGVIYSTNITPDADTGIGRWTKADFERALRSGVAKDGTYLYPAMPFGSYTKMTDADIDALWAYISSVPAVKNVTPKNTLPFPLNVREGLAAWRSFYFEPGKFVPTAAKGEQWNRGAYLVEALAHCAECHTPRNALQGLEPEHQLTGATIEGWYAPDISSGTSSPTKKWNNEDYLQFLRAGIMPNNGKAIGPMQEVVHDSLQYLSDNDLKSMVVYLKDQGGSVTPTAPSAVKLARLDAGKQVYEDNCSSCHRSDGKGQDKAVPALAGNDAVTAREPYNLIMAILEGFPPQGSWGAMASFANTLSDDQIADVSNYVRTAWNNPGIANATPWSVATWRKNAEPSKSESHALLCPNLNNGTAKAALAVKPAVLKGAALDRSQMSKLVSDYQTASPDASKADTVEALSAAYCRAVSADPISLARMSAQVDSFAQHVAVALRPHS